LETFLGKELVEKQISPVLSGVYSGKLSDLTIASTLPFLVDYKNEHGSIIRGLEANKEKFKGSANSKFLSFKNGLATLIDRLEERLIDSVEIVKGVQAEKIEKVSERYKITLANDTEVEADYVVLSTPDTVAKQLLQDSELNEEFDQFVNSSLISIYLGFDIPDRELPNDGTGFIATGHSDLTCQACTWTSRKWAHTSTNSHLLVRLFYKSSSLHYETLRRMTEAELEEVALTDIKNSLGITGKPVTSVVTKWHDNMPNYHIHHNRLVESLQEKMKSKYPNILLAGCSYYGVGIPDCITNGEYTAEMIIETLGEK
jgi:oxygen-dependent protoporphyrinogen oxidase